MRKPNPNLLFTLAFILIFLLVLLSLYLLLGGINVF